MNTLENPSYAGRFPAQAYRSKLDVQDEDDDPILVNVSDYQTCILAKHKGTDRNSPIVFRVCSERGQLPRNLKTTCGILVRQPIFGDSISAVRVTYQAYDTVEQLLASEWEATLDVSWIRVLKSEFKRFYGREDRFTAFSKAEADIRRHLDLPEIVFVED